MRKLDLYAQLSRPFTLLPPLLGIISGAICAWGSVHNPDPDHRLTLSVKTVESHRKSVMDKLEIHSVAELTKYAIREGLTPLE